MVFDHLDYLWIIFFFVKCNQKEINKKNTMKTPKAPRKLLYNSQSDLRELKAILKELKRDI